MYTSSNSCLPICENTNVVELTQKDPTVSILSTFAKPLGPKKDQIKDLKLSCGLAHNNLLKNIFYLKE